MIEILVKLELKVFEINFVHMNESLNFVHPFAHFLDEYVIQGR